MYAIRHVAHASSVVRAALAAVVALAAAPACAGAHAIIRPAGDVISFTSPDATSTNTLTLRPSGSQIEFHDPTVDGGIDPGHCTPGELSPPGFFGQVVVQAFCPAAGVQAVRVDLGARDDTATVSLAIPVAISGGPGSDELRGGSGADQLGGDDGDDTVAGGDGPDVLTGGLGVDDISGDAGDDDIRARDGIRDIVRCATGTDTVDADTLDEIDADCEAVTRTFTTVPVSAAPTDRAAPRVTAAAPIRQRISRTRRIRVFARSTETGFAAASGTLNIAGLRVPLKVVRRPVRTANRRVTITVTLTQLHWRQARRALGRRRAVSARITVVATDRAGNSRKASAVTIRLVP